MKVRFWVQQIPFRGGGSAPPQNLSWLWTCYFEGFQYILYVMCNPDCHPNDPSISHYVVFTLKTATHPLKEVSDSNSNFLWQQLEDNNEKKLFPKFQFIPIYHFQVMHDYVHWYRSIDYYDK